LGIFSDQDRVPDLNRRSVILCLERFWRRHLAFCFRFLSMRIWQERRSRVKRHFHLKRLYLTRNSRPGTPSYSTKSEGLIVLDPTILGVATSAARIIGSVTDSSQKVIQEVSVAITKSDTNVGFCDGRKVLLG